MYPLHDDPLKYYNRWLTEPIVAADGHSVLSVLNALNQHALAQDETAQDYVIPPTRYREKAGRFRILGENQDTWFCFIYEGTESQTDPSVYFETSLDLRRDHGYTVPEIIDGDHVKVCSRFTDFLWHLLGRQICLRLEDNGFFAEGVHGIAFDGKIALDDSFVNPLDREFPAGYPCFLGPKSICVPDWGTAFLNLESGRRFVKRFSPRLSSKWP